MQPKAKYPLLQVMEVKKKRVEDAEKVLKEKQQALQLEEQKLKEREAARDKVKNHQIEKLQQLRNELDSGTTSPKVQQMKTYLKIVQEKLVNEEKKVKEQQANVETAKKNVELAREDLNKKRLEVDKLDTHRKSWIKEVRKEEEIIEGREQDELGNIIHASNRLRSSR